MKKSFSSADNHSSAQNTLPDISWDPQELLELLEDFSNYSDIESKIQGYLTDMKNCITQIKKISSRSLSRIKKSTDLLQRQCDIIMEITEEICELSSPNKRNTDRIVCEKFRNFIRELTSPFEKALKELTSTATSKTELQASSDESQMNNETVVVIQKNSDENKTPDHVGENIIYPRGFSSNPTISHTNPLPDIPWNRDEINAFVKYFPKEAQWMLKEQVALIEKHLDKIKEYKKETHFRNLYFLMLDELERVIERIDNISDRLKEYDFKYALFFSFKELIVTWIMPLKDVLVEEVVIENSKVLKQKTQRLYAQQSYVRRNLSDQLEERLLKIKTEMEERRTENELPPCCYISYAWPHEKYREEEYWVQPFLNVLYCHLSDAGVRMKMDIQDVRVGDNIPNFMAKYAGRVFILSVGTRSLLKKHHDPSARAVKTELNIIRRRVGEDQKRFGRSLTYPLLLSGTIRWSYPEDFELYRNIKDARDGSYFDLLENLISWLNNKSTFSLWQEEVAKLPNSLEEVNAELAHNYHRHLASQIRSGSNEYLYTRTQRVPIQSTQITTVREAETATYNHALGSVEDQFAHEGKEFQRPQIKPVIIPREDLYADIMDRFDARERTMTVLGSQGQGGVGKTHLAKRYYLKPPRAYQLRAWFDANDRHSLIQQYITMAREIYDESYPDDLTAEQKAKRFLKERLQKQKTPSLFVYDNVANEEEVGDLLPQGNYHILITTRNENFWPAFSTIKVDVFSEQEACALINKITAHDEEVEALIPLVRKCKCIPIVLRAIANYMSRICNAKDLLETFTQVIKLDLKNELSEYLEILTRDVIQLNNLAHLTIYDANRERVDGEEQDMPVRELNIG